MAPLASVLSFFTLALAVVGSNAALHETRSRQHAADLQARAHKIGAIAPRHVALANDSQPTHKRRTQRKKRCKAHQNGGSGSGHTGSSTGGSHNGGGSNNGGGSSDSGSGSGSGSGSSGGDSSSGGQQGGGPGMTFVGKPTSGFVGKQTNSLVSWFRSNYGGDSTNGNSWCGYPYTDDMPLFAPDLSVMGGATWDSDPEAWKAQTKEWCGLEAIVTWQGKSVKMYIGDGFDPAWVKTPAAIDVLQPTFAKLFGSWTDDKNDVCTGATWELTGYKNDKYASPN